MRRPGKIKDEKVYRSFREVHIIDFKEESIGLIVKNSSDYQKT